MSDTTKITKMIFGVNEFGEVVYQKVVRNDDALTFFGALSRQQAEGVVPEHGVNHAWSDGTNLNVLPRTKGWFWSE